MTAEAPAAKALTTAVILCQENCYALSLLVLRVLSKRVPHTREALESPT